jgi:hypothetical protein
MFGGAINKSPSFGISIILAPIGQGSAVFFTFDFLSTDFDSLLSYFMTLATIT